MAASHSNALLCARYCEMFRTWLEFEEESSPVAIFIKKNIDLLTQIEKWEMDEWAKFMRETSPLLYNRFSHEGSMMGSMVEFGRMFLKEKYDPLRINSVGERLTNMMKRLGGICEVLGPIMTFLKDAIETYGFIEMVPLLRDLYHGAVELLVTLRDWIGTLMATLNNLDINEGHQYVCNILVVITGNDFHEAGPASTLWGSTFSKFWGLWIDTKTSIVEVCHRCVVAIVEGTHHMDEILTDKSLGDFVNIMDLQTNVKQLWFELSTEIQKDAEKLGETTAVALRDKFTWGHRLSQINSDFYTSLSELNEIMKQTNERIINGGNRGSNESPPPNTTDELIAAAERLKTKLDLYVSCVETISRGRKVRKPSKPRPSPASLNATGSFVEDDEVAVDSSDEKSVLPELGVFTNTSRNIMDGSSDFDDDEYDNLSDEFFQARGGDLGVAEKEVWHEDCATDFTQATFRNVVTELKDKLTDVKENMDIREKRAFKKSQGDQAVRNEFSSDEEESLVEGDSKEGPGCSGDYRQRFENLNKSENEEWPDLHPPPEQPTDFGTELRMVMSQLQQSETEEFECEAEDYPT